MNDYGKFNCEYCGRERGYPSQLETRNGKFVCKDVKSCDEADDKAHADEDES